MNRHHSNQGYGTPWEFIRACEHKFRRRVVFDLAANEANAKAEDFFGEAHDSLAQNWCAIQGEPEAAMLWLNPPFSQIAPWAAKCAAEIQTGHCLPILMLSPASIGANWFRDSVFPHARVLALNGRIQFVGASDPYPKDCMICAFGLGPASFEIWKWMEDTKPA